MPRRLNAGVPLELEQVVMWALNKSPADRPQEADQLITALEQAKLVIVGEQRGQRTAAMAAVVGVGAHKGAVAAGVIEHPARVQRPADVIVADDHAEESSDEPPPQEDRKRRSPWPWLTVLLVALVAGGAVAAYLLTRPTKLVVPNVVRESLVAASTQLQNDGFAVSTVDVPDSAASGTVIRQTPLPGVKANSGSTVTLTVSAGLGNTTVPGVQDISLGQAKRAIVAQHLKVGNVVGQASDSVPAGEVINTSPGAGQALPVGSPVEIFVSTGRPNVTVPDVTGESQTDARSTLNGQGFTVQTTTETSSSVAAGDVIGESPSPGSSVAPGTTVTLVIAKAAPPKPASATVPNVVGQQPAAAQSALTGAGFKVAQKTKDVVNPAKDGVVVSQTPPANATANQGATVTIVVGHYKAPTSSTPTTTTPTSATTPTTTSTTP